MSSSRFADNFLQRLKTDGLIRSRDRVLIALSGGSDSVALLYLLSYASASLQLSLCAAHLDHGIREQSGADADFVRSLCARLQIPFSCARVDVPALAAQERVGLEEAGRIARQDFLLSEATRLGCTAIALGHHRGDQAETLLHHLSRGCGLHGLAAMRPQRDLFVRPLLPYAKAELQAYLDEVGGEFVCDASNAELVFTRNRIRHQLLPLLTTLNPQIEATLSSLAGVAAREDDYWQVETERLAAIFARREGDGVSLSVAALLQLHPAQRFRLLHHLLTPFALQKKKEVSLCHVESLDLLLASTAPQGELHLAGVRALRRYDQLTLRAQLLPLATFWSLEISGPGAYPLPCGGELHLEAGIGGGCGTRNVEEFDASDRIFPLTVRTIQPGDRLRLVGMSGRKRLKELMMEQKIPLEERRRLCVLEKGEILWAVGLRRTALYLPQVGRPVWRVIYVPYNSGKLPEMP